MNLGVVTLNLPRIALEAQGSQEKFWQILNERLAIVKDALVYRVERVKEVKTSECTDFIHVWCIWKTFSYTGCRR